MQKKVIASLMVTPMALSAMADIQMAELGVDKADWTLHGFTGSTTDGIFQESEILCPVGVTSISSKVTALVPGTYKVSFPGSVNTVVNAAGAVTGIQSGDGYVKFTVPETVPAAGIDVEITIKAKDDSKSFSIKGGKVAIDYDFAAKAAAYLAMIKTDATSPYYWISIPKLETTAKTMEFKGSEEYKDYDAWFNANIKPIETSVQSVRDALLRTEMPGYNAESKTEAALAFYKENKLYSEDPEVNGILKKMAKFTADGAQWRAEVNRINAKWAAYDANVATRDARLAEVTTLQAALDAVTAEINKKDAEGKPVYAAEITSRCSATAAQNAIDTYKTTIDTAFGAIDAENPDAIDEMLFTSYPVLDDEGKDTGAVTYIELASQQADVQTLISNLDAAFNNAVDNYNVFFGKTEGGDGKSLETLINEFNAAYTKAQIEITGVHSAYSVNGIDKTKIYSAMQTKWMKLIAASKTAVENKTEGVTYENIADLDEKGQKEDANYVSIRQAVINATQDVNNLAVNRNNTVSTFVKAEEDAYVAAYGETGYYTGLAAEYQAIKDKLEAMGQLSIDSSSYKTDADAIGDALDDFKAAIDAEFVANKLSKYNASTGDIDALISAFNTKLGVNGVDLKIDAQTAYNEMMKYLREESAKLEVNGKTIDLTTLFKATTDKIQSGINAITDSNADVMAEIKRIKGDKSSNIEGDAPRLINALKPVATVINSFKTAYNKLSSWSSELYVADYYESFTPAADKAAYAKATAFDADLTLLNTALNGSGSGDSEVAGWLKKYGDIAGLKDGQEVYDAAVKLKAEIDSKWTGTTAAPGYANKINALAASILSTRNSANVAVMKEIWDQISKKTGAYNLSGFDFTDSGNKEVQLHKDLSAAETAAGKVTGPFDLIKLSDNSVIDLSAMLKLCDAADKAVIKVVDALNNLVKQQKVYNDLYAQISNNGAVVTLYTEVVGYNSRTSIGTNARKAFNDIITGYWSDKEHGTFAIKTTLDNYLAGVTNAAPSNVSDHQSTVQSLIDALKTDLNSVKTAIDNNEANNKAQLAESENVRKSLGEEIAKVQKLDEANTGDVIVADYVTALENILNNDLLDIDRTVAAAYGSGKCPDDTKAYTELLKEAQKIYAGLSGEGEGSYAALLKAYNDDIVAQAKWETVLEKLDAKADEAVIDYNRYRTILNTGYKSFLEMVKIFESHDQIFDSRVAANALNTAVETWLTDKLTSGKAITLDEFKAEANVKAEAMTADIDAKIKQMDEDFMYFAIHYGAICLYNIDGALDTARESLAGAGFDAAQQAEILGKWETPRNELGVEFQRIVSSKERTHIAIEVNRLANDLDKLCEEMGIELSLTDGFKAGTVADYRDDNSAVNELLNAYTHTDISLQDLAQSTWTTKYNAAVADFNAAKAVVTAACEEYGDLADHTSNLATINTKIGLASTLNTEVKDKKNLISVLATDLATLQGYVDDVNACKKVITDNHAAIQGNRDAQELYGSQIGELGDALKATNEVYAHIGGVGSEKVLNTANVLAGVSTVIGNNATDLVAGEADIKKAFEDAYASIDESLFTAYNMEKAYLFELIKQAKVSANNAKVNGHNVAADDEKIVALEERVNELALEIISETGVDEDGLAVATVRNLTPAEFATLAIALEEEICAEIDYLQSTYNYDTVAGELSTAQSVANLEAEVLKVQTVLDEADTTIKDYLVYEEYAAQIAEKYQSVLDAIQSEFENLGSTVIAQENNYADRIQAVTEGLEALLDEAHDANEVAETHKRSEERYAVLDAGITPVEADYAALVNLVEGYGFTEDFQPSLDRIKTILEDTREDLNALREAYECENTDLALVNEIAFRLASIRFDAMLKKARNMQADADAAINTLSSYILDNLVVDTPAYDSDIRTLRADYNNLQDEIINFRDSEYEVYYLDPELVDPETGEHKDGVAVINSYFAESQRIADEAAALLENAKADSYIIGDVDEDGTVDAMDVQELVTMVGRKVKYTDVKATVAHAADVTGDGRFNIGDVAAIVTLSNGGAAQSSYALVRGVQQSSSALNTRLLKTVDGVSTYAITLENNEELVAGQIDLSVAYGSEIVSVSSASESHDVQVFDNDEDTRVIISSADNEVIASGESSTIIVEVKGNSSVGIGNAVYADRDSKQYSIGGVNPETTGIDSIIENAKVVKEAIYDAAGRAYNKLQRGLNIIRHSDGTVTKEIH